MTHAIIRDRGTARTAKLVHVPTTDTRAVQIAKKFYAECFAGYYGRDWNDLPASQQYRFIRAAYMVLDMQEDWE